LISWKQYFMNLMVILYVMLLPNHFWALSQLDCIVVRFAN
jgi:hypothetical protein